jgi:hypothetical protein
MASNWKPWWEKVADFDTQYEREQFVRGIAGARPSYKKDILFGLIAGYVGGKAAQPKDSKNK